MTRLIVLPNDQLQLQLESPLPAAGLAQSINSGSLPEVILHNYPGQVPPLRAVCVGSQVVIFPRDPLEAAPARRLPLLSARPQAVLCGMAEGLTTNQIAERLGISPRTVEHHMVTLRKHLGEGSRPQLVARAITLGLISPALPPPIEP